MFNIFQTIPHQQKIVNITPYINGSEFYVIASIATHSKDNIIFIARDEQRANVIYQACKAFIPDKQVLYFPGWDSSPYELTSPSAHVLAKRIFVLTNIIQNQHTQKIIITSVDAATQKIPVRIDIASAIQTLNVNEIFDRNKLINHLIQHNYIRTATANDIGEFSVRGSIIDIVVNDTQYGYRIDFLDNNIESIKIFKTESQLSVSKAVQAVIMPPSELILSKNTTANFKHRMIARYGITALQSDSIQNIERGKLHFIGVEQWLPLFYKQLTDIFSFIAVPTTIFHDHMANSSFNERFTQIKQCYKERLDEVKYDQKQYTDPLSINDLYLNQKTFNAIAVNHRQIFYTNTSSSNCIRVEIKQTKNIQHQAQMQNIAVLNVLKQLIKNSSKKSFVIACISLGSRDRIERILRDHNIATNKQNNWNYNSCTNFLIPLLVTIPLETGFSTNDFTLITEQEIFGYKVQNVNTKRHKSFQRLIQEVNNFAAGEIVVHLDHGIGRFDKLEVVNLSTTKHDCLKIVYDGGDILYVPVENIEVISKYGIAREVKLDKLGSASWQARKAKFKNRIKLSAKYLLNIAAEKLAKKGDIIIPSTGIYDEFCATFPYQETDDQLSAIEMLQKDFAAGKSMDRLICGDVGFGKTEVAIRAAFMVLKATDHIKRQVALICPTTLLCKQHFRNFTERFKNFDINIKQLSRFVSTADTTKIIEEINQGKVDIVVATHALLNQKIKFHNLALLIIDEEQHFGVLQKEKLKERKANVHVLSLSATPIPRTLQMSLTGIKDLSIIATPPIHRLAIKTSVLQYDSIIIKEAILREFHRGGQIFYVCPRISDMNEVINTVTNLTPELRLTSAHGQMASTKLEKTMNDFYSHKSDILVCTSIIESGLDILNANTIIVHRADKFGLSQLYQLRGRVGRSKNKAYAYFTTSHQTLPANVMKKLEILQKIDSLGAGFSIASHDMDIRGFGNLLGDEQSGHIKEVGIELYQNMLQQTIKALKTNSDMLETEEELIPQINVGLSVLIPENYIHDLELRLNLYQRISILEDESEIEEFAVEMIDRFGPLPQEFEHLITIVKLKQLCLQHHIKKVDAGPKAITLEFYNLTLQSINKIVKLASQSPEQIKIRQKNKVLLNISLDDPYKRINLITKFIKTL